LLIGFDNIHWRKNIAGMVSSGKKKEKDEPFSFLSQIITTGVWVMI
jgi:hypothetical protein